MCHEGADPACDETCLKLSAADMTWWASVFRALGDPVRLKLLLHLAERRGVEVPVHEIGDVGVSLSTVSHHLKVLRCIGLVESRRDGRIVYYRLGDGVRSALMQIVHQHDRADV